MAIQFGNSAWQYRIARMKEKEATKRQREAVPLQLALGLGKALFSMWSTMGTDAVKYFGMGGKEEQKGRIDLASSQMAQAGAATERFQTETLHIPKKFKLEEDAAKLKQDEAGRQKEVHKARMVTENRYRNLVEAELGKPIKDATTQEIAEAQRRVDASFKQVTTGPGTLTTVKEKRKGPKKIGTKTKKGIESDLNLYRQYMARINEAKKSGKPYIADPANPSIIIYLEQAEKDAKVFYDAAKKTADKHGIKIGSERDELVRKPGDSKQGTSAKVTSGAHLVGRYKKETGATLPQRFVGNSSYAEMVGFILQGYSPANYEKGDFGDAYVGLTPGIYFEKNKGNPLSRDEVYGLNVDTYNDFDEILNGGFSATQIKAAIRKASQFRNLSRMR